VCSLERPLWCWRAVVHQNDDADCENSDLLPENRVMRQESSPRKEDFAMKRRFSEEQIIGILREQEAGGAVKEIARRHGISEQSFYRWKAKYGGMEVSDARRLRELEAENGKLKRLLAEAHLDNAALKDVLGRKW
jgi:putative transposase